MPRSTHKTIARARMQYLGEPRTAALGAVPRDGSLGLDTCSTEQRRLRALMALGLFNRSRSWQPHRDVAGWGSTPSSRTTSSPRPGSIDLSSSRMCRTTWLRIYCPDGTAEAHCRASVSKSSGGGIRTWHAIFLLALNSSSLETLPGPGTGSCAHLLDGTSIPSTGPSRGLNGHSLKKSPT